MPGPGKCKTIDRKRRKPTQKRYVASGQYEKNQERKKKTAENRLKKKRAKAEGKILSVKTVSGYEKVRNVCPKLCFDAHTRKREELHIQLARPEDGYQERFKQNHILSEEEKEKRDWLQRFYPKLKKPYSMIGKKKKQS